MDTSEEDCATPMAASPEVTKRRRKMRIEIRLAISIPLLTCTSHSRCNVLRSQFWDAMSVCATLCWRMKKKRIGLA